MRLGLDAAALPTQQLTADMPRWPMFPLRVLTALQTGTSHHFNQTHSWQSKSSTNSALPAELTTVVSTSRTHVRPTAVWRPIHKPRETAVTRPHGALHATHMTRAPTHGACACHDGGCTCYGSACSSGACSDGTCAYPHGTASVVMWKLAQLN